MSGSQGQGAVQSALGFPQCGVDIYPYEGGAYSITGAQVLSCDVSKDISTNLGVASIILAPGGPNGPQASPSWSEVVTLRSLVVIAMSRAGHSNVVFVGVVSAVEEVQSWQPGTRVIRNIRITARDWTAWFQDFQWSAMAILALTNGLEEAFATNLPPDAGLPGVTLSAGEMNGNPAQVGWGWFKTIMGGAGSNSGILSDTAFQYAGASTPWSESTTAWFQSYPIAVFPSSYILIAQAGNWESKFLEIFDSPWYELLIGTIPASGVWFTAPKSSKGTGTPVGAIESSSGAPPSAWYFPGKQFSSKSIPAATPALAAIVARLNPQPDLILQQVASGTPSTGSSLATQSSDGLAGQPAYVYGPNANADSWNSLQLFTPDYGEESFIDSTTTLILGRYANFFLVNPLWMVSEVAGNNPSGGPYPIIYSAALNPAGIHRFGLHSYVRDSQWFADSSLLAQQSPAAKAQTFNDLYAGLTTRCASLLTPTPIMRSGDCVQPLRPDVFPGCRWRFKPFRDSESWDFYIRAVHHTWKFGGPSRTEIIADRGLPSSVYANPQTLKLALTGNLLFVNGVPTEAPKSLGPTLQTFSSAPSSLKTVLGEIAGIYVTPQSK